MQAGSAASAAGAASRVVSRVCERLQPELGIEREHEDDEHHRHDRERVADAISTEETFGPTRLCIARMNSRIAYAEAPTTPSEAISAIGSSC